MLWGDLGCESWACLSMCIDLEVHEAATGSKAALTVGGDWEQP